MIQATYTGMLESVEASFSPLPQPPFVARLLRALREGLREFIRSPLGYLRLAFLPQEIWEWLPLRLLSALGSGLAHPLDVLSGLVRRAAIPLPLFFHPPPAPPSL